MKRVCLLLLAAVLTCFAVAGVCEGAAYGEDFILESHMEWARGALSALAESGLSYSGDLSGYVVDVGDLREQCVRDSYVLTTVSFGQFEGLTVTLRYQDGVLISLGLYPDSESGEMLAETDVAFAAFLRGALGLDEGEAAEMADTLNAGLKANPILKTLKESKMERGGRQIALTIGDSYGLSSNKLVVDWVEN